MSGSCAIRVATAADLPAVAALLHEMAVDYDGPAAPSAAAVRAALERHVFAAGSGIDLLVAEAGGRLLGLASVSTLFPAAGCAPALFIKDIYVTAGARSRGVGTALMRAVAGLAVERGCSRINWNADRSNSAALAFYARLGAQVWDAAVALRLDADAMTRLAAAGGGD